MRKAITLIIAALMLITVGCKATTPANASTTLHVTAVSSDGVVRGTVGSKVYGLTLFGPSFYGGSVKTQDVGMDYPFTLDKDGYMDIDLSVRDGKQKHPDTAIYRIQTVEEARTK
jgi:hypothetical protein